nr:hypothetical protein Iba_chr01bCG15880 [Ipomoea batatas]
MCDGDYKTPIEAHRGQESGKPGWGWNHGIGSICVCALIRIILYCWLRFDSEHL